MMIRMMIESLAVRLLVDLAVERSSQGTSRWDLTTDTYVWLAICPSSIINEDRERQGWMAGIKCQGLAILVGDGVGFAECFTPYTSIVA